MQEKEIDSLNKVKVNHSQRDIENERLMWLENSPICTKVVDLDLRGLLKTPHNHAIIRFS